MPRRRFLHRLQARCRDRLSADPPNKLACKRAWAAAHVQHTLARADSAELGQLGCELRRVSTHEPVIGFSGDLEGHRAHPRRCRSGNGGAYGPNIRDHSRTARPLAAFANGELVGTVQVILALPPNQPHPAETAKLLVHRSARRRGIAQLRMERAEVEARAEGKTLLVLDTVTGRQRRAPLRATGLEQDRRDLRLRPLRRQAALRHDHLLEGALASVSEAGLRGQPTHRLALPRSAP